MRPVATYGLEDLILSRERRLDQVLLLLLTGGFSFNQPVGWYFDAAAAAGHVLDSLSSSVPLRRCFIRAINSAMLPVQLPLWCYVRQV